MDTSNNEHVKTLTKLGLISITPVASSSINKIPKITDKRNDLTYAFMHRSICVIQ